MCMCMRVCKIERERDRGAKIVPKVTFTCDLNKCIEKCECAAQLILLICGCTNRLIAWCNKRFWLAMENVRKIGWYAHCTHINVFTCFDQCQHALIPHWSENGHENRMNNTNAALQNDNIGNGMATENRLRLT